MKKYYTLPNGNSEFLGGAKSTMELCEHALYSTLLNQIFLACA